jgi:hypothetical protein
LAPSPQIDYHATWRFNTELTNMTITVNIGKGIDLVTPAFESFTQEVKDHIVYIGLRNILMDSHAGITEAKADGGDVQAMSRAVAEKKLAALVAGEVRTTSVREGDPVKKEAMRLALAAVDAAIRGKGKKPTDFKASAKADKARSVMEKFMAQARKNVEAANAAEVNLDDLI